MSSEPTKARTARQAKRRRAKAAHGKRRAAAPPAQDNPGLVPVPPERFPTERRGAVIAALWRLAEEQTRALEGPRGAPLGSSELKALVDVLERLSRLEERAAARDPLVGEDGIRPFSFIESSQLSRKSPSVTRNSRGASRWTSRRPGPSSRTLARTIARMVTMRR